MDNADFNDWICCIDCCNECHVKIKYSYQLLKGPEPLRGGSGLFFCQVSSFNSSFACSSVSFVISLPASIRAISSSLFLFSTLKQKFAYVHQSLLSQYNIDSRRLQQRQMSDAQNFESISIFEKFYLRWPVQLFRSHLYPLHQNNTCHTLLRRKNSFQSKQHPRQFATRSDFHQRLQWLSWIGRNIKFDLVKSIRFNCLFSSFKNGLKLSVFHIQTFQFMQNGFFQFFAIFLRVS